jgi:hypothetical protein
MIPDAADDFRRQLIQAREDAVKDAEAFDEILYAVERLGSYCLGRVENLGAYKDVLAELAGKSPLSVDIPNIWRQFHTPFDELFSLVRNSRNDAMHIGASARHLTTHAIELALILEDALGMQKEETRITDVMVRDPLCAHLWQPISLIRRSMLANSFSYLPVKDGEGQWRHVSDLQIALYLQGQANSERKKRLGTTLADATSIKLVPATCVTDDTPLASALQKLEGPPILIFNSQMPTELIGVLSAFDLL